MARSHSPINLRSPRSSEGASSAVAPAAVITGPQQVELQDCPIAEPGAGQIRVRLDGCGVCASNLPVWEGRPWFDYPQQAGAPGHEGWGTVDAVGAGVDQLREGDRVALLSYNAYATYDLAEATAAVKLPAEFQQLPFLGEPLACAINVFRRSEIAAGHTVAIIGIGFLGALLAQLAAAAGARVLACSRRGYALDVAAGLGAEAVFEMADGEHHQNIIHQVMAATGDRGCDRVLEVTGKQEPLELAAQLVAVRGKLIIAGYHQDGLRHVNMQLWNWRGIDVINAHERDSQVCIDGMHTALQAVRQGRMNPLPLYTHHFPLSEIGDALEHARQRPDGFMKAVVWADQQRLNEYLKMEGR